MATKKAKKKLRRTAKQLVRLKKRMIKRMGGKCTKCGYNKFYGALSFHHKDKRLKRYEWKQMKHLPVKQILIELKKTELLCLNCHAELHHEEDIGIKP